MKGAEERSVTADDIDLKRHAFVEASAGTGKTFLIENITARIVAEGLADIDQLLVVTFTEKAAGELRERIRGRLESGARDAADPVQKERLERSLLRFDGAVVDTIHGFCGQVLRQYGADLGFAPGLELVDDRRTLLDLLRTRMRERWPGDYGDDLVSLLGHTRLATWEDVVPGLAAASLGDILRVKPSGVEPVVHLLRRLAAVTAGGENPEGTEIESLIDPAWKVETIRFLHDDLSRWKDEHGCMSHFDTVDRVAQALGNDSVAGASFLSAMRRRFRYGIVDEFQDTDTRQWSIFKKIFLESPESKL
ncbi:MAG: UvrD-helicase domain-containing protein, partial [Spirochaetia bacterium]|nr:UvrD-helicase domain-containing protein [Spirochaetia bacterium]